MPRWRIAWRRTPDASPDIQGAVAELAALGTEDVKAFNSRAASAPADLLARLHGG